MLAPDDASNKSNDETEIDTQLVEICNSKNIHKKQNTQRKNNQAQYHVNVDSESTTTGDSESTENSEELEVYSQKRRNTYMVDQSPPDASHFLAESLTHHFSRERSFTNTDVNCFDEYKSAPV